MTGPLGDTVAMRRDLGLLVDSLRSPVQPATLLDAWQPDGAVWYSHACCSAGSDSPSAYAGLLDPSDDVDKVLTEVAGLGATVAPLPTALLGADKPLRAFIGHVEPTFEWTIKFPWTQTDLTAGIRTALYDGICGGNRSATRCNGCGATSGRYGRATSVQSRSTTTSPDRPGEG